MEQIEIQKQFLEMISQNEAIVYKVASFYAAPGQTINDLYQEIVLNLWKAYPSFRNESKVSTWIYRIALNTCITFFRRYKKQPSYVDLNIDIPEVSTSNDDINELYRLINRLGKLERALILLYLDEKSYKEISEITGLTLTNVATKISRVKEKLKKMSDSDR